MNLIDALQTSTPLFFFAVTLLGLTVGSFLNVVIYRLPRMMQDSWHTQCQELLNAEQEQQAEQSSAEAVKNKYNLVVPRSACPSCGHKITALENIPVISYLFLKGKCSSCETPISIRYPILEIFTAVLSVIVAAHFGFGWQCGAALLLTWALICLSVIDFDHKLLPDDITLPFLWLGLLVNINGLFTDINASVIGAIAGYLSLWSVYWLFKLLTGKEGMGYGDFKLLAMLGAWLGWQSLPGIVLLSSFVGALIGISLVLFRGRDKNIPIPFGPYLAIAGWIYLLWGENLTQWYFSISGIQ